MRSIISHSKRGHTDRGGQRREQEIEMVRTGQTVREYSKGKTCIKTKRSKLCKNKMLRKNGDKISCFCQTVAIHFLINFIFLSKISTSSPTPPLATPSIFPITPTQHGYNDFVVNFPTGNLFAQDLWLYCHIASGNIYFT